MHAAYRSAIAALSTIAFLLAQGPAVASERVTPARPDVVVVGGTPAGVAAAVAAARHGATVALVASGTDLGGILTGAMMDQWDLNLAPDGTSIEEGIFDELYDRLGDVFSPATAARTLAQFVAEQPRIDVWYDETPVAVATSVAPRGRRVDTVTFANTRSGALSVVGAPFIVDATDAADVAVLAGAHYDVGRQDTGIDERAQAVTEMFTVRGVDWHAVAGSYDALRFGAGGVSERRAWGYAKLMRAYRPSSRDVVVRDLNFGRMSDGSVVVNAVDVFGIDGLDRIQLERARRLTQAEAARLVEYLRVRVPGFEAARVDRFAADVYVRETRHIAGDERVTSDDVWLGRIPSDSIGLSSYPIDLHPVDASDRAAFAPIRHVYGIPFGALIPKDLTNVVLAGPAVSATHLASGSLRVVPSTIEEGQAAGVASAFAFWNCIDFQQFAASYEHVSSLRRQLAADGVLVGVPALGRLARVRHLRSATGLRFSSDRPVRDRNSRRYHRSLP